MRDVNNSLDYNDIESKQQLLNRFKSFFLKPIFIGLFTFSIFFSTILATKVVTYLLAESTLFNLNIYDILFAMVGFGVGFLVEFLLQIRRILAR